MKGKKTKHEGIRDLGDGWFLIRVTMRSPETGRRKDTARRVKAASLIDAIQKRDELERELRREKMEVDVLTIVPPVLEPAPAIARTERLKLGDIADAWLDELKMRRLEEDPTQLHLCNATRMRYEGSVRDFVKPFFGDWFVDKITAAHVKDWRTHLLEQGYRRATVNGHHRVLRSILRTVSNTAAVQVSELSTKPDARITRKEPNLLTADELDRFLAVARESWPQHYPLILVLFTTTMRLSTALALRRDDVDLETMEFIVRRRLSEGVETPGVKRDRLGEDAPPMLAEVHDALKAYWATFNAAEASSGLMFPAKDGRHHARTVLRKAFKDILAKAGIHKRFTPHGCRRTGEKLYGKTAGTRLAMEIAGHTTTRMHEHYTPIDASEKQAAARAAFGGLRLVANAKK